MTLFVLTVSYITTITSDMQKSKKQILLCHILFINKSGCFNVNNILFTYKDIKYNVMHYIVYTSDYRRGPWNYVGGGGGGVVLKTIF